MAEKGGYDQRGQKVSGNETNINEANAPVFTGDVGVVNVNAQEKPPTPKQIPLPPQDFTGREDELAELASLFERSTAIVGLRGLGGVGKSALAFALAERVKDRFPDGQIFVSMQGTSLQPLSAAGAMSQVIRSYQPALRLPESEAELANLYRSVLEGKRALLLLDNALDYGHVRPLLPPAECSLIVTSRRKFKIPGMILKDLDVLKLDKAVELLLSTAGEDHLIGGPEKKAAWEDLARLCGGLPVAIRAVGSFLANSPDSSPEQYARELQDEKRRLERIGKDGVEEDLNLKLSLSYGRLPDETAQVFRLLSVFPTNFDARAEEVICQDEGHRHLSELLRWSLVEFQRPRPEAEGRYHLHDLVRLFAASLPEHNRELSRRHAAYYQELLWKANDLLLQGGDSLREGLQLFDLEWMNIQRGQNWTIDNAPKDLEAARICSNFAWTGSILGLRLHPQENVKWLQAALSAARQIKSKDAEGAHLGNLGNAYYLLVEPRKAIEFYEQALAIDREIGDRRGVGNHLGNLGVAYADLVEPRKAIEYYEQALAIAREIGDRRNEGSWLGNLGLAYATLGEPRKAIEYYEQALAIAREIGDRMGKGTTLGNLGNAYADLAEPRKAIEYHEQALSIAREIGDRRNEGAWLGSLGNAYYLLGEPRKAIEFHEQALAIDREIGDRRGEGNRMGNLGLAYADLGEPRKAIEHYEQALTIAREIGDRRGEGADLGNLGNAYYLLGEPRKAIEFYEQALTIAREIGDRRGEGNHLGNLGNAYAALGETHKAIEHYDHALAIAREIGDRMGEGNSLGNLGNAYAALGDPRKAIECYDHALAITRETGDRMGEGNVLGSLGNAHANLGDPRKAIEYYEQQLVITREIGDRRGEGADLGNLGLAYADLGEPRKAIEFYEQQLMITRAIGDRRGEGSALFNTSLALDVLGKQAEAAKLAADALAIYKQIESPVAEKVRRKLEAWQG